MNNCHLARKTCLYVYLNVVRDFHVVYDVLKHQICHVILVPKIDNSLSRFCWENWSVLKASWLPWYIIKCPVLGDFRNWQEYCVSYYQTPSVSLKVLAEGHVVHVIACWEFPVYLSQVTKIISHLTATKQQAMFCLYLMSWWFSSLQIIWRDNLE